MRALDASLGQVDEHADLEAKQYVENHRRLSIYIVGHVIKNKMENNSTRSRNTGIFDMIH